MADNTEAIKAFMRKKKDGQTTGSEKMVYDPGSKKFVLFEGGGPDALPPVTDEDLAAFGGSGLTAARALACSGREAAADHYVRASLDAR